MSAYVKIDVDTVRDRVPHPTDERKEFAPIRQRQPHSRCKVCSLHLVRPDLLIFVNSWMVNGIRHKDIIGWVRDWAEQNAARLDEEERDVCHLYPNNLSRHKKHIESDVDAMMELQRSQALIEHTSTQTGIPLSLAAIRVGMGMTHRELLSRDLDDVDTDDLLRAITSLGRADAAIEKHLVATERTQEELEDLGLQALSRRLTPEQRDQVRTWLQPAAAASGG